MIAAIFALAAMLGGGASVPERVFTPEGWYQIEAGEGETKDSEAVVIVADPPAAPVAQQECEPAADLSGEVARFAQIDCDEVRGRYLERVLELYGVDTFRLEPRALAAWTRTRPPPVAGWPFFNGAFGEPALSVLWGEPPVPPGLLSADFELQILARDVLRCDSGQPTRLTPSPIP